MKKLLKHAKEIFSSLLTKSGKSGKSESSEAEESMNRDKIARIMIRWVWILFVFFAIASVVLLIISLLLWSWVVLAVALVSAGIAVFIISYIELISTEKPLQAAMVTVFGKNTNESVGDGWQLPAPYLGMKFSVQTVEFQTLSIVLKGVPCKFSEDDKDSAVDVDVEATVLYGANPNNLLSVVKHGGLENVGKLLQEMFEEDYRQFAFGKIYQELGEAKDAATVSIISNLVAFSDSMGSRPEFKKYNALTDEEKKDPKIVKPILEKILSNGIADEHNLGILIKRVNFSKVEPGEKTKHILKESEDKRTQEIQSETAKLLTKAYREAYPHLSDEKLSDMIMILDKQITKTIVQVDGEGKEVGDIAKGAALLVAKDTLSKDKSGSEN